MEVTPNGGFPTLGTEPFLYVASRGDTVETSFGQRVADPYRWLEDDNSAATAAWVAAQNKVTDAYLATLPGRDQFAARIKTLFNYERFGAPVKKGGRYFYAHNAGLQNQAVLWVRDALNAELAAILADALNLLEKDRPLSAQVLPPRNVDRAWGDGPSG